MTGHESKTKTKEKIISPHWWRGMDTEIEIYIKSCYKCQRTQKEKRGSTIRKSFTSVLLTQPENSYGLIWTIITMPSGKKFIMCNTDAFSKDAELVAIPDKNASNVAPALFS
jgi:hypothetical protein